MTYLAHTGNTAGLPHILSEHLQSVGNLARRFAEESNPDLCDAAYWAGMLHDLGKYRDEFQQYLRAERDCSTETHHAVYGAALAYRQEWLGPAFAIAGHHAGLHDHNELQTLVEGTTYRTAERVPLLAERFKGELGEIPQRIVDPLFSCERTQCRVLYSDAVLNAGRCRFPRYWRVS